MKYHLLFSLFFILIGNLTLNAQGLTFDSIQDYNSLYQYVLNEYGMDQILVNGRFYEDKYYRKTGHQFFLDNKLYKGKIIYRGKEYKDIEFKYDIYEQQLVLYIKNNNDIAWIVPSNDFITEFCILNITFLKYNFQGEPKYYQKVYEGDKLKCLYYWFKEKHDAYQKGISYEFTNSEIKRFLELNGSFETFSTNKSFIKLFPNETRNMIRDYIKSNKIKVAKCDDKQISELLTFCNSLL